MSEPVIIIKQGREKPIIQRHPWVFSGAIERIEGDPAPGAIITVRDSRGQFLARGYWNVRSQIQVRMLTWVDETIDAAWWRARLRAAATRRDLRLAAGRLVNAENDFLPGLIADYYGEYIVLQALTLHIDQHKTALAAQLAETLIALGRPVRGVYERSDVDVRGKEGLKAQSGVLWGEEPPPLIEFERDGLRRLVDVRHGHKTGYYLDQMTNHALLWRLSADLPAQSRILNTFCYTGAFGLGAAGQRINVDASRDALALAEQTHTLNGKDAGAEFVQADVFDYLREQATAGELFDAIVLDPPKFAHNAGQVDSAARGYKDINLNAFRCLKPGGWLLTFSCSGAITTDLFQKIVFGALADTDRQGQIVAHLDAAPDHPIALTFPEGSYLKGLLVRVV